MLPANFLSKNHRKWNPSLYNRYTVKRSKLGPGRNTHNNQGGKTEGQLDPEISSHSLQKRKPGRSGFPSVSFTCILNIWCFIFFPSHDLQFFSFPNFPPLPLLSLPVFYSGFPSYPTSDLINSLVLGKYVSEINYV